MTAEALSVVVAIICAICTGGTYVLNLRLRAELSDLRAELARQRTEDWEKLREYVNGSFMRASEVRAQMEGFRTELRSFRLAAD